MWVVREGYEGLVRGNSEEHKVEQESFAPQKEVHIKDETFVHNLRFGDGELLRDGTADHPTGRTLKGRYIVRVGWDDVRGWFGVVRPTSISAKAVPHRTALTPLPMVCRVARSQEQLVRLHSARQKAGSRPRST